MQSGKNGLQIKQLPATSVYRVLNNFPSETGKTAIGQKFQNVSVTDGLAAKRIEKLNDSELNNFSFQVFNPFGC